MVHTCLSNFRNNLSTAFTPQTFEEFNDLYTEAYDLEIHLNKRKKGAKESKTFF